MTGGELKQHDHRHLGQSGLVVSEISYGNWITHGSQGGAATLALALSARERGPE
jgi:hypothetical protein